jgi:hypothetical protein
MNSFIYACIPTRILFVLISYYIGHHKPTLLPYLAIPGLAISIGFLIIYKMGWRKTGVETGGKPIWWNSLRPVHASFYLLFSYYAIKGSKYAWIWLAFDVLLGIAAYLHHTLNDFTWLYHDLKWV